MAAIVGGDGPHQEHRYPIQRSELWELRSHVARHGQTCGLPAHRVNDLVLVANELTSNVIRHGGGSGQLRLWADSRAVWCEVSDTGSGITDPDRLGMEQSRPETVTGRGIWIIRRLADEVTILTGRYGTTITVTMTLPPYGSDG